MAVGFTVMLNVKGVPEQPFADGITVIEATLGSMVLFVVMKEGILPVPLAARPMVVLLLVHA